MSRIYISAISQQTPSHGGFGLLLYQGSALIAERQQTLPTTSPLLASVTAARAAVLEAPAGESTIIISDNPKLPALFDHNTQIKNPKLKALLSDIHHIIHQRKLDTHWQHQDASGSPELQAAQRLASIAQQTAWATHNSPVCPKCGGQMIVEGETWICRNPNCHGRLETYQLGSL